MKYLFPFFLILSACADWTFGIIGTPDKQVLQKQQDDISNNCTRDEQCGPDLVCFKTSDSYVGTCAQIIK